MTEQQNKRNGLTLSTHFVNPADWISQAEAARIRGVSRQAIARLVAKGRFKVLNVAGRVLLKRSEVESYKAETPGRPARERKNRSD
jgi:excisionase family DNA binding protein